MSYRDLTDLRTDVDRYMEANFSDTVCNEFILKAEDKVYALLKGHPLLRKTEAISIDLDGTGVVAVDTMTASKNITAIVSVVQHIQDDATANSEAKTFTRRKFLTPKDPDFLLEAYPEPTVTAGGTENAEYNYYSFASITTKAANGTFPTVNIAVAPVYSNNKATFDVTYESRPPSLISFAGSDSADYSYLNENYYNAIFYGCLVEASLYSRSEPDIVTNIQNQFTLAVGQLKADTDSIYSDEYRPSGKAPQPLTVPAPPQPQQR